MASKNQRRALPLSRQIQLFYRHFGRAAKLTMPTALIRQTFRGVMIRVLCPNSCHQFPLFSRYILCSLWPPSALFKNRLAVFEWYGRWWSGTAGNLLIYLKTTSELITLQLEIYSSIESIAEFKGRQQGLLHKFLCFFFFSISSFKVVVDLNIWIHTFQ